MTITLFEQTNFRPVQFVVNRDSSDLRESPVGYSTSSMRMTTNNDRVLLFKKAEWDGNVIARRGRVSIGHIGKPGQGGRDGFNNSVRSCRISNFRVRVAYHVVRDGSGNWPGSVSSRPAMETFINRAHNVLNNTWNAGFLRFDQIGRFRVYDNERVFNFRENLNWLKNSRAFSLQQNAVNFFLVNTRRANIIGQAFLGRIKLGISVGSVRQPAGVPFPANTFGLILAHEVGHVLGLGHGSAEKNAGNIMFPTLSGGSALTDRQIERVHRRISRTGSAAAFRIE